MVNGKIIRNTENSGGYRCETRHGIVANLLNVQAKTSLEPELIKIDGLDDAVVGRHVEMLFYRFFIILTHSFILMNTTTFS